MHAHGSIESHTAPQLTMGSGGKHYYRISMDLSTSKHRPGVEWYLSHDELGCLSNAEYKRIAAFLQPAGVIQCV